MNNYEKGLEAGYNWIKIICCLKGQPKEQTDWAVNMLNSIFQSRYKKYQNEKAPVKEFRQEACSIIDLIMDETLYRKK